MTELARLKFYATQPHPCSYLPEEQATTLFLDPSQPMDVQVYAELSEMGFRRSGDHLYRPHCQRCTACVPARIHTDHETDVLVSAAALRRLAPEPRWWRPEPLTADIARTEGWTFGIS